MRRNILREKLDAGLPVLGPFCKLADATVYELAGLAGFDFAIIDMEHGPVNYETAQALVRACEAAGISPVIRVPENRPAGIQRALDLGAHAVQVPEINTADGAAVLVSAARFHPSGQRGVCRYVRAADYSRTPAQSYFPAANREQLTIAHIEGRTGFENLDAILATEGLDILFIGPYDLSQSLGLPGQTEHPRVRETMAAIARRARTAGRWVGTFVESPEQAAVWAQQGVQYLSYSVDVGLILKAFTEIVTACRKQIS